MFLNSGRAPSRRRQTVRKEAEKQHWTRLKQIKKKIKMDETKRKRIPFPHSNDEAIIIQRSKAHQNVGGHSVVSAWSWSSRFFDFDNFARARQAQSAYTGQSGKHFRKYQSQKRFRDDGKFQSLIETIFTDPTCDFPEAEPGRTTADNVVTRACEPIQVESSEPRKREEWSIRIRIKRFVACDADADARGNVSFHQQIFLL